MQKRKINISIDNSYKTVEIELINQCLHCHTFITPYTTSTHIDADTKYQTFAVAFQCLCCGKYLLTAYKYDGTNPIKTEIIPYAITPNIDLDIPKEITETFPKFVKIYKQALISEYYGLDEIIGISLRKSIEFLVKDYLIRILKEKEDVIEKISLGRAIDMINDTEIHTLAKAAVWIGNDETHYIQKHPDKNFSDIKYFLRYLLNFMAGKISFSKAYGFIEASRSK